MDSYPVIPERKRPSPFFCFCFLFNTCLLSGDSFLPNIPVLNLAFPEAKQFKHSDNPINAYFPPCNKTIVQLKTLLIPNLAEPGEWGTRREWPLLSWAGRTQDGGKAAPAFTREEKVMTSETALSERAERPRLQSRRLSCRVLFLHVNQEAGSHMPR